MNYETRLRIIREKMGINQQTMACKLNVARQNYSFWETGMKFIPLKHLNNYCNLFGYSMDYIMKLSDDISGNNILELNKKEIGKKIKLIRQNNNVTQQELATFLNTTHSTISAYESGKTLILTAFAYQICKKYNVSLDWLCGRKEN